MYNTTNSIQLPILNSLLRESPGRGIHVVQDPSDPEFYKAYLSDYPSQNVRGKNPLQTLLDLEAIFSQHTQPYPSFFSYHSVLQNFLDLKWHMIVFVTQEGLYLTHLVSPHEARLVKRGSPNPDLLTAIESSLLTYPD